MVDLFIIIKLYNIKLDFSVKQKICIQLVQKCWLFLLKKIKKKVFILLRINCYKRD